LLNSALKNSMYTALIKGTSIGGRVFAMLLAAYFCPSALFAKFVFFLATVEIIRSVLDFGLDTYLMRVFAMSNGGRSESAFFFNGLAVKAVTSVIGLVGAFTFFYMKGEGADLAGAFALMVGSQILLNLPLNYYLAKGRVAEIFWGFIIAACVFVCLLTVIFWSGHYAAAFYALAAFEISVSLVLLIRGTGKYISLHTEFLDATECLSMLKSSMPVGITLVVGILNSRMDVFILEWHGFMHALASYGAAVRLVEPFLFVAGAVAVSAYSHLSREAIGEEAVWKTTLRKYTKIQGLYSLMVFVALSCVALVLFVGKWNKYEFLPQIILCLALITVVRSTNLITTAGIQSKGGFKLMSVLSIWNLLFSLVGMLVLVPILGVWGVLLAAAAMECLNQLIQRYLLTSLSNDEIDPNGSRMPVSRFLRKVTSLRRQ